MPVHPRPEGGYLVTVCHDGKRYRKASRNWTFQDAREYERAIQAQVRDVARGRQPQRLIADALVRWLADHVSRLGSARQTRNHARRLLPYIDGRRIEEIPEVWAAIKAEMHGYAPATINHLGRILRQLGNMAWREWRWIEIPPAIHLLPETARETFLTLAQVEALAEACHDERAAGYVLLAAYTGIRRGHLLRLTRHDVEGDFIVLDRSGKTRRLQRIPLHPRVRALAARLPLGIGDRQLRERWTQARAETGLRCRWHDLRHSCASWLVQAGVPIYTVAEILGHSSVQVTKRYAHLAPQHLQDAIEKLA